MACNLSKELIDQTISFHGHWCPGLAIGIRAAEWALNEMGRSGDEEIVTVTETDMCGVDAIQFLLSCTFGKGNLIYRDHGKHVVILLERHSGRGIRISLKAGAIERNERHQKLLDKVRGETATAGERDEFRALHLQKAMDLLNRPLEDLFTIREIDMRLPPKARTVGFPMLKMSAL